MDKMCMLILVTMDL